MYIENAFRVARKINSRGRFSSCTTLAITLMIMATLASDKRAAKGRCEWGGAGRCVVGAHLRDTYVFVQATREPSASYKPLKVLQCRHTHFCQQLPRLQLGLLFFCCLLRGTIFRLALVRQLFFLVPFLLFFFHMPGQQCAYLMLAFCHPDNSFGPWWKTTTHANQSYSERRTCFFFFIFIPCSSSTHSLFSGAQFTTSRASQEALEIYFPFLFFSFLFIFLFFGTAIYVA